MYIHLGGEVTVETSKIIAIMEQAPLLKDKKNTAFIESRKKAGNFIDLGDPYTKSVVITEDTVYLSPFSTLTLRRRLETGHVALG